MPAVLSASRGSIFFSDQLPALRSPPPLADSGLRAPKRAAAAAPPCAGSGQVSTLVSQTFPADLPSVSLSPFVSYAASKFDLRCDSKFVWSWNVERVELACLTSAMLPQLPLFSHIG